MRTYVLGIENFMKIQKANIPLKGVIGLVGKNAQGKTSVIKALQDLLTGKNDATKIRDGADKAVISITATDENTGEELFTIARSQTRERAQLQDKGLKSGQTPAGVLGCLVDEIAINPVRLLENGPVEYLKKHLQAQFEVSDMPEELYDAMKADDQLNELLAKREGMNGFQFCEEVAGEIETARKVHAREMKNVELTAENQRKALPDEMPEAPYSQEELHKEETELRAAKENAKAINAQANERDLAYERAKRASAEAESHLANLEQALADLEQQARDLRTQIEAAKKAADDRAKEQSDAAHYAKQVQRVDIAATDNALMELVKKQSALKNHQVIVNAFSALKDLNSRLKRMREQHEQQDRLFKFFRYEAPKKLIEKCNLGVAGVEFRDGEMYVQERHISKMSTAERALVATKLAITIAKQKGHIAVCLDGVENLDQEHMGEFIKAAEESEIAVIYTRAGEAPEFACERLVEGGVIQ